MQFCAMILNVASKILHMLLVCHISLALCEKNYWSIRVLQEIFFSAWFLACKG